MSKGRVLLPIIAKTEHELRYYLLTSPCPDQFTPAYTILSPREFFISAPTTLNGPYGQLADWRGVGEAHVKGANRALLSARRGTSDDPRSDRSILTGSYMLHETLFSYFPSLSDLLRLAGFNDTLYTAIIQTRSEPIPSCLRTAPYTFPKRSSEAAAKRSSRLSPRARYHVG